MTASAVPPARPTPLQMALALTLVRTKPSNVSVREYILSLRQHIHAGPRPQFSSTYAKSQTNYINAAFYFEAQLKTSQKKNEELRNRIGELERLNPSHGAFVDPAARHGLSSRESGHKSAKDRGTEPMITDEDGREHPNTTLDCLDAVDIGQGLPEATLLRHIYSLQTSLRETPRNLRKLGRLLSRTCTSFDLALDTLPPTASPSLEGGNRPKRNNASARAFVPFLRLLFAALDSLVAPDSFNPASQEDNGSTSRESRYPTLGTAIYSFAALFQRILDRTSIALTEAKPQVGSSLESLGHEFLTLLIQRHHTKLSMTNPPAQGQAYAEILKGTLYILLTRAGSLLYAETFAAPRHASIAAEMAAAPSASPADVDPHAPAEADAQPASPASASIATITTTTDGSSPGRGDTHTDGHGVKSHATQPREARFIASLLQRLLPHYRSRDVASTVSNASALETVEGGGERHQTVEDSHVADDGAARGDIAAEALRVLQNTLVAGIFGSLGLAGGVHDDDEEGGVEALRRGGRDVEDLLRMPRQQGSGRDPDVRMGEGDELKEEDGEGRDWFARKMWELVGWEVLARGFDEG